MARVVCTVAEGDALNALLTPAELAFREMQRPIGGSLRAEYRDFCAAARREWIARKLAGVTP